MTLRASLVIGLSLVVGLLGAAYLHGRGALEFRALERTVTVKGLAERELPADIVIWPIRFTAASDDLVALYETLDADAGKIREFLVNHGIAPEAISAAPPAVTDKLAQAYNSGDSVGLRYAASRAVTVYTDRLEAVRAAMLDVVALGRSGIALSGDYEARPQYLFTGLNAIKPSMIEEATREARRVAEKFAADSDSRLGRIRRASQGQFSIDDRDQNTPHIKKVRVVSTIEYYLSD